MVTRTCHHCGCTYETFPSVRKLYCGIACSNASKCNGVTQVCPQCGKPFYVRPSERTRTYCSKSCFRTAVNLTPANPSHHRDISGERNPMYGRKRTGTDNAMFGKRRELCSRWKGGRKQRADGYCLVTVPPDHPYPADKHPASGLAYALEHRVVMEQHIGRHLLPTEIVHHIDGNPSNNAIENLELLPDNATHRRRHSQHPHA